MSNEKHEKMESTTLMMTGFNGTKTHLQVGRIKLTKNNKIIFVRREGRKQSACKRESWDIQSIKGFANYAKSANETCCKVCLKKLEEYKADIKRLKKLK